jgi:N-acyl-phosphatidylethanolamine-hydrolysing phospholipase D
MTVSFTSTKSFPVVVTFAGMLFLHGCTFVRISVRNVPPMFHAPARVEKLNRADVPTGTRLSATWIGHSTVLIQMDGAIVLTDPILTNRIGLVSKRLVEPGMNLDNIPRLTAVVVSHLHFDHLSPESLKLLGSLVQRVIVPPGTAPDLKDSAFVVRELATWQTIGVEGIEITAVPAEHDGGRTIGDRNSHPRSFTGYLIRYHGLSVYFPGDTAYRKELFAEVNKRYGPVDLALMPIGPIAPVNIMQKTHMDPAQAIEASGLLQARTMLPVHFETFVNSLDKRGQDRESLVAAESTIPHSNTQIINWHIGPSVVVRGPLSPARRVDRDKQLELSHLWATAANNSRT